MRIVAAALLALSGIVSAQTWTDVRRDCTGGTFGFFKNCVVDLFRARPVHLVAASVVPGGGVAMGARYTKLFNSGGWQNDFQATAASSLRAYWFTDARVTMTRRPFGADNSARDRFAIRGFVKTRNLPQLPYYGIGPRTSSGNRADYEMNDQRVGATLSNPLSGWMAVGGTFESIWTQVNGVADADVTSIEQRYNELSAPGLARQPHMLHSEVFVRPHMPAEPPYGLDYRIGYNWYHDTGTGEYSFSRFVADLQHNIYPEGKSNRDSLLNLRAYFSTSFTSAGRTVPFYFQETLGGSDINGQPTLRGFRDFRFRGPHAVLFQAEYSRRVWGPVGPVVFYDAGTVAARRSDLSLGELRQTFGGGVAVYLANRVVFKAVVGLGSGEGRHLYFGIPPGLL